MDSPEIEKYDRYNSLLNRHRLSINLFYARQTRTHEDGRDLQQEVLVALWESLEGLYPDAEPWQEAAWVRRVMVRTAIDHGRRRLSHRRNGRAVPLDHLSGTRQEGGDDGLFDELLAYLAPGERELFEGQMAGYSAAELARMHGVSADGIRQRMYRIRKKMRTIYNKLYGRESE